jgi:2-oxoglutarate ferredoxin oxidoreductase subunit gamma
MIKTIRIAGFGGQGVMLLGQIIAHSATIQGLNAVWVPTYGPETRGGTANCMVTISDGDIYSPVFAKCDHLIVLNEPSYQKFKSQLSKEGLLVYNASLVTVHDDQINKISVDANELAILLNEPRVSNFIMLGAYMEKTKMFEDKTIIQALKSIWGEGRQNLIEINKKALSLGRQQVK